MRRGRTRIAISLTAVLGLAAAYAGYWYWLTGRLQAGIVDWIEAHRADGLQIDCRAMARTGFPFNAAVAVSRPIVGREYDRIAWRWRGEGLRVAMPVYRFDRLVVATLDPSSAVIRRADGGEATIGAQALRVVMDFDPPALTALELDAQQVVATSAGSPPVHLRRLAFTAHPDTAGAGDAPARPFALRAEDVTGAALIASGLGGRVEVVDVTGVLRGPFPDAPPHQAVRDWRDGGGVLDVSHMRLVWGPVRAIATGTLTLDAALRPFGVFAIRIAGYDKAIDALVAQRRIDSNDAGLLKSFLAALAAQKGDRDGVPLPLHVQNGRVWLGPKAVANVGPLF